MTNGAAVNTAAVSIRHAVAIESSHRQQARDKETAGRQHRAVAYCIALVNGGTQQRSGEKKNCRALTFEKRPLQ